MPEIIVHNLGSAVVEQLESRPKDNGRSLQSELKLILENAARPASKRLSRAAYRALADEVRAAPQTSPKPTARHC